jgi:hypothetical protein
LVQGITYPAANSLVSMFSSQPIAWLP